MRSPSQREGRGWEALLEGWEKSRVPPGGTIGIGSPLGGPGGLEALKEGWECQESLPECREGSGGPP